MKTEFATSEGGVRIAYDVSGAGPTLLLLHGAGKTRQDWHRAGYVDRLQAGFTVVAVDLRGSGESAFLTRQEDYAIEKMCVDVLAVADACGARRFALWGYSFGGNIGRYVGANTERVSALASIGVPFGPAVDAEFDRYVDGFLQKYGPIGRMFDEGKLPEKERSAVVERRLPVWLACLPAMRGWPAVEAADLRCPSLMVVGTENPTAYRWAMDNREALAAAGVQLEILEGLTHEQEFGEIDRVYPAVVPFLERHSYAGADPV